MSTQPGQGERPLQLDIELEIAERNREGMSRSVDDSHTLGGSYGQLGHRTDQSNEDMNYLGSSRIIYGTKRT